MGNDAVKGVFRGRTKSGPRAPGYSNTGTSTIIRIIIQVIVVVFHHHCDHVRFESE